VAVNIANLAQSVSRVLFVTNVKSAGIMLACTLLLVGTGTLAHLALAAQSPPPQAAAKAEVPPAPRTDRYGDPLPEGALLRLGTEGFRQGNFIYGIALSPDGQTVASIGGNSLIHVWATATGRELRRFDRPWNFGTAYVVAISPDGHALAVGGQNGVLAWDLSTGKELFQLQVPQVQGLAFSPDGSTLATGDQLGGVYLWSASTGKQLAELGPRAANKEGGYEIGAVTFSPDGKLLAAGRVSQVHIWDLMTGKVIHKLIGHFDQIVALAFSADGKVLASGSSDRVVRLWDPIGGKELRRLEGHEAPIASLAFTADGKTLITGSGQQCYRSMKQEPKALRLWDVATGREIAAIGEHGWGVTGVAVMPDGQTLVAGGGCGSIQFWDLATLQEVKQRDGHRGWIGAVTYSPDGKTIVTGGGDNIIRVWEAATGKELRQLHGCATCIDCLAFSPDGKLLASGSRDSNARIWDFPSGKELRRLQCSNGWQIWVAFSPDGKLLATGTRDLNREDKIKIWDVATGKELVHFGGPKEEGVCSVAFSPDGKTLASGGGFGYHFVAQRQPKEVFVRLWDVATGAEVRQLCGESNREGNWTTSVAFSPDGQLVAAGSRSGMIQIWDMATGKTIRSFDAKHSSYSVGFSPDGRTLGSAGHDGTAYLWEVATGLERKRFTTRGGLLSALAYAPDGETVATGCSDTTVLVWEVRGDKERQARLAPFTEQELDMLWIGLLASGDGSKSYDALRALAVRPEQTIPFVMHQLQPIDPQRLAQLLRDLDSDQFALRDQAMTELAKCAEQAEPEVRRTLKGQPSLELRRRANELMVRTEARAPRITEVFELIGTEPARKALEKLAAGQTETRLTQEAKAALERWEKRAAIIRSRRL
jgi:WD40 repeat protein